MICFFCVLLLLIFWLLVLILPWEEWGVEEGRMMRRRSEGRAAPAGAQAQVARHGRANEAYVCMGRREGGREGRTAAAAAESSDCVF